MCGIMCLCCRVLILLVLGHQIVHVALRFRELHFILVFFRSMFLLCISHIYVSILLSHKSLVLLYLSFGDARYILEEMADTFRYLPSSFSLESDYMFHISSQESLNRNEYRESFKKSLSRGQSTCCIRLSLPNCATLHLVFSVSQWTR